MEGPVDFSWFDTGLHDGKEYEMKVRNNVMPQLKNEWDLGGDENDTAGYVDRNIIGPTDISRVIVFARDLMNRGGSIKSVVAALQGKFPQEMLNDSKEELSKQLDMNGFVGRVVVDARGYGSCREAMAVARGNRFHNTISGVYGCTCGEHDVDERFIEGVVSTGDAIEDFLGDSTETNREATVICRETRLPVFREGNSMNVESIVTTAVAMGLPQNEASEIMSSDEGDIKKIKAAFRRLDKAIESIEDAPIDSESFMMDAGDYNLDLNGTVSSIDVDMLDSSDSSMDADMTGEFVKEGHVDDSNFGVESTLFEVPLDKGNKVLPEFEIDPNGSIQW
tara:strand:- start:3001 stop:4008 length:1008 start_codon:yes stop_codon:yes gene_type:complete